MSNPHCGADNRCVLSPSHVDVGTAHRDGMGQIIALEATREGCAESVRSRCVLEASTLVSEASKRMLVSAAALDPYITFAVMRTLDKPVVGAGPEYIRGALRNHGLNI